MVDAEGFGAQDILARPFTDVEIQEKIDTLLRASAEILTTQAVPQETLDALRGTAAGVPTAPTISSPTFFRMSRTKGLKEQQSTDRDAAGRG